MCAVRSECLCYALVTRQPCGVWGGFTSHERNRIAARLVRAGWDRVSSPSTNQLGLANGKRGLDGILRAVE